MRPGFQSSQTTYRNPIIEIHQRLPITYQSFSKIAKPLPPARQARIPRYFASATFALELHRDRVPAIWNVSSDGE
jgi:hypothetical protein